MDIELFGIPLTWLLLFAVSVFLFTVVLLRRNKTSAAFDKLKAATQSSLPESPLDYLKDIPVPKQIALLDQLAEMLWQDYRREDAAQIIVLMFNLQPEARSTVYQIRRLVEVEPDKAIRLLGRETLLKLFPPPPQDLQEGEDEIPGEEEDDGLMPEDLDFPLPPELAQDDDEKE